MSDKQGQTPASNPQSTNPNGRDTTHVKTPDPAGDVKLAAQGEQHNRSQPASVNAPDIVVTSRPASLENQHEALLALHDFRMTLFQVLNQTKPDNLAEEPSHAWQTIKGFLPWHTRRKIDYESLIAKYIGLWPILERADGLQYSMQAVMGLQLLKAGRIDASYAVFSEIEFQTSTPAALSYVMRGIGIFIRSVALLAFALFYTDFLSAFFSLRHVASPHPFLATLSEFFSTQTGQVFTAAISGMLGSVVSLLMRLDEFETTRGRSKEFLTLTGATLPVVGGVFGAFVAAMLSSKVINIAIGDPGGVNAWLYVVLGFLSGFSERFSRGFVQIAEDRFGSKDTQVKLSAGTLVVGSTSEIAPAAGANLRPHPPPASPQSG